MKLKLNTVITNIYGTPLKNEDKKVTLRDLAIDALLAESPNEKIDGKERYARGALAEIILKAGSTIELESNDIMKIKERIGERYTGFIVKRAWDLLEGKLS